MTLLEAIISALTELRLSCPLSNDTFKASPALIQSHLQLGSLDFKGSVATRTENPPVRGWLNRGSNWISVWATTVNQQMAEWCDTGLITATHTLM